MAWNLTDNWQTAKILTGNWHLYPPPPPPPPPIQTLIASRTVWLSMLPCDDVILALSAVLLSDKPAFSHI